MCSGMALSAEEESKRCASRVVRIDVQTFRYLAMIGFLSAFRERLESTTKAHMHHQLLCPLQCFLAYNNFRTTESGVGRIRE